MKKTVALLITAFLTTSAYGSASVPQCYGHQDVSADEPFLLSLNDVNEFQVNLVSESLMDDGSLLVTNVMSFSDSTFALVISVNNESSRTPADVNKLVYKKVRSVLKQHSIRVQNTALECNGRVGPLPRAGGMNGN